METRSNNTSIMKPIKPVILVTDKDLLNMSLSTESKDPTGKYPIVVKSSKVENLITHVLTKEASHKFALAPEGFYWKYYTERCYYRFEWYSLESIPI